MPLRAKKILYIDDELENLSVFTMTFRHYYQVIAVDSAEKGFDVLRQHNDVNLVIADQRMPGMSGVEFLEAIVEQYPDPVRMILTGFTDTKDIIKAINRGRIYHYATKPWDMESLKIVLDKGLEHYELRKANADLVERLKDKNLKLEDAIDSLEMFLYRSSHDLRGPLSTQMGLINLCKGEVDLQTVRAYLEKLGDSVHSMMKVLGKLEKINTANLNHVYQEQVNIPELLKDILDHQRPLIESKKIQVTLNHASGDEQIFINPDLFRIMLENVVENALLYTRVNADPVVEVDWKITGHRMSLQVRDNGVGIDHHLHHKIFEPFFRGSDRSRGNGLGLYIARKIASKLNGEINVTSEPGQGTTFKLDIPLQSTPMLKSVPA